ncbi:MAG: hypothetical protein AAB575_02840 [Patescibacteria group bacterium]
MKKEKNWDKLTEKEKDARLDLAEKYWDHHDRHGSSLKAIKERAKLYPEGGIPIRPLPKDLREELKHCKGCSYNGPLINFLNPTLYGQYLKTEKLLKRRFARERKLARAAKLTSTKRKTG